MRKISSIDTETGVILDYALVAVKQKIPNGFYGGWVAMAQNPLLKMANEIKRLDDFRVRDALLARLDFENYIHVVQSDIAKDLGMRREHVNHSIKRLIALGVLLEGPKIGRSKTYRLNPNYGWRGSAKSHHKALRAAEKASLAGLKVHEGGKASKAD